MEDLDLCYRFAEAGWTTWFEPSVTVVHIKAGTSGEHRSLRLNYAFHYGMFRFYRDHYAPERSPLLNLAVYAGIAVKFAAAAASQRARPAQRALASERGADPLDRRRVGREQRLVPARRVGVGEVRARQPGLQVDQGRRVVGELERELVGARLDLARELVAGDPERERGQR